MAGLCNGPEMGVLVAVENLLWFGHDVTERGSKDVGESADVVDMASNSGSR